MSEYTGKSYDPISKNYAEKLEDDDKAPWNAYSGRPGVLSLLLDVAGLLVFSARQPVLSWQIFKLENYHEEVLIEDEWEGAGKVQYYHRSPNDVSRALRDSGFVIDRLLEPHLTVDFRRVNPEGYQKVEARPWFLLVRARRF